MGCALLGNRLNFINSIVVVVSGAKVCVMGIIDLEDISTLLHVIGSAEENVHLFERDSSCLGNEEEYEGCEAEVDTGEEVECVAR